MIHVVTAANRHLYEHAIEDHFRIRHDIFVGERGWKALARPDGREVDAYDNEDTVYLLAMEGARVTGGNRLYPTLRPTMLAEVFSRLAAVRGVPSGPQVWEWTRQFIVKERREGPLAFVLMAAVQEFCLEEGITELCGVMGLWLLPQYHEMGLVVRPLGLPEVIDGAWTMATKVEVSSDALDQIRSLGKISGPILVRRGPQQPVVKRVLARSSLTTAKAS